MIDPARVTNYNLDLNGLEENILFWVLAAGKDSVIVAKGLNGMLMELKSSKGDGPFEVFRNYKGEMVELVKRYGIGCYTQKTRTIRELITSGIDLRGCSPEDLERVWGIGKKTSRCYIMHTREGARCAGLDVHILKFLRDMGIGTPNKTPGSAKEYSRLEEAFLSFVPGGMSVAEFDLLTWNAYSRNGDSSNC